MNSFNRALLDWLSLGFALRVDGGQADKNGLLGTSYGLALTNGFLSGRLRSFGRERGLLFEWIEQLVDWRGYSSQGNQVILLFKGHLVLPQEDDALIPF